MKFLGLFALALTFNAFASDYYVSTIDWNARHLEDNTVLMCDDNAAQGVEIVVPGDRKYPEGSISYKDCGADWKLTQKKIIKRDGKSFNAVRFTGSSSCVIEVYGPEKKVFTLDIGDAC